MDVKSICRDLKPGERRLLNEAEAKQVLQGYDVPVVSERVAATSEQAVAHAEQIGYPVVLKGLGSALTHKTEQGLVHLDIRDRSAVAQAFASIMASAGTDAEGVLVQAQMSGSREWVAGMVRDAQFGPVIMFGLGGILTEALQDVAFRLPPLSSADIADMIAECRAAPLLNAFRGQQAVDRLRLEKILMGLSRLALDCPDVAEVDINPLVVDAEGRLKAVDALMVLEKPQSAAPVRPSVPPRELRPFFYPRSIAFIGASATLAKWGHMLVVNIIDGGYAGDLYLVNRNGGTIAGRPAYRRISDIEGHVELAVVTIPAGGILELIPQLKAKHIKSMLVITSGFSETGTDGRLQEKELAEAARAAGIRILGPNTMGICNPHRRLNCTSLPVKPLAGDTALVSQSGNMGTQFLAFAESQAIGIRAFCGTGNEAMTTIEDFLEAFESDTATRTVMVYVESVKNGRRFFETARRLGMHKPVILMKGGQSRAGQRAAQSHTGALGSDSRIFNAMCRQAGIVKVEQSMALLDLAAAFSSLPLPRGNRVGIMTLGGGWGVVTADLCNAHGLDVPSLPASVQQRIDPLLPPFWSRSNPVDLVGEHDEHLPIRVIETLLQWDDCDAVINLGILGRRQFVDSYFNVVRRCDPSYADDDLDRLAAMVGQFETNYVQQILDLMETYQKPVLGVSLLTGEMNRTIYEGRHSEFKCVFYATPERAVKALAKMVAYAGFRNSIGNTLL